MRNSDWSSDVCSSDLVTDWHKFSQQFHLDTIEGVGDFITVRSHTSDCLLSYFLYVSNFEVRFSTTYRTEVQCDTERSAERSVGKECVSTCRSRGSRSH